MAIKSLDSETFSGFKNFKAGAFIQDFAEQSTDVTQSSNIVELNYSLGNVFYQTNAFSASATVNIINAPTSNNLIFTTTLITPNSASVSFRPNNLTVNGSAVTIRWAAGITPNATITSNKFDIWSFTILRRSNSYTSFVTAQLNY